MINAAKYVVGELAYGLFVFPLLMGGELLDRMFLGRKKIFEFDVINFFYFAMNNMEYNKGVKWSDYTYQWHQYTEKDMLGETKYRFELLLLRKDGTCGFDLSLGRYSRHLTEEEIVWIIEALESRYEITITKKEGTNHVS